MSDASKLNVTNPSETAALTYSVWQSGATAAREGKPITANPWNPISYKYVAWSNGWAFAKHMMTVEQQDEEL